MPLIKKTDRQKRQAAFKESANNEHKIICEIHFDKIIW